MTVQQAALESGARYVIIDPSAGDVDLTTAYPGFDADSGGGPEAPATGASAAELLPRYIMFSGGDLDITDVFENEITLSEVDFGGKPLPMAPSAIRGTSVATSCLVIW